MNSREEEFYEIAGSEILSETYKAGLWNKAYSMALGDEAKCRAFYIKFRVEQLEREHEAERKGPTLNAPPNQTKVQNSNQNSKANKRKGGVYYSGAFLYKIGYFSFIIYILSVSINICIYLYNHEQIIFSIIAFILTPLTALIGPLLFSFYRGEWDGTKICYFWLFMTYIFICIGNWLKNGLSLKSDSDICEPKKQQDPPPLTARTTQFGYKSDLERANYNFGVKKSKEYNKFAIIIVIFIGAIVLVGFLIHSASKESYISQTSTHYHSPTPTPTPTPIPSPSPSPSPSPTPIPNPTANPIPRAQTSENFKRIVIPKGAFLEIREAPVLESKIVARFQSGSYQILIMNTYTDINDKGWTWIRFNQHEGWLSTRTLNSIKSL
jgi:hypothetical protein